MEYHSRMPFLQDRIETLLSDLIAITANANRDAKEHPRPFMPNDFAWWRPKTTAETGKKVTTDVETKNGVIRGVIDFAALNSDALLPAKQLLKEKLNAAT